MKTKPCLIRATRQRQTMRRCAGCLLLAAVLAAGSLRLQAQDQPQPTAVAETPATPAPAIEAIAPTNAVPALAVAQTAEAPAANASAGGTNGLRLNFRNAPIDLVLNYLSDAAGFIIELDTNVRGSVSVISSHPMTKDEAVDLLNSVLNRNGYAAIRSGERTLKIMDKAAAKLNNPVKIGNEPSSIPNNDEMVTQIIPIRYVEASQLVSDISPFVSSGATIIANQAGNSVIITDTQANIRHLVEIIKAIDSSAEDVTEVRVFKLRYADPTEMATLLAGLFPDQSGTAQSPIRFGNRGGGRGGFPGGGFNPFAAAFGGGGNQSSGGQTDRIKKRNQVVAVADARTSSVVVTATKDLMEQIAEMVDQLDHQGKAQRMEVIRINNADPSEVLSVLQDTVGASSSSRNSRSTQSSPFQTRIQQNQSSSSSSSSFGNSSSRTGSQGRTGGF
ncbi:MAG TPA: secretin N-terminal domain-containing protein [Candidatus Paceibacterota bacterium]|nr:secretin N-terminal domain-containing protein [Candidatus Paceibacterota bacterium]